MGRSKKMIAILAAAAVVIAGALVMAYASGVGTDGAFLWGNRSKAQPVIGDAEEQPVTEGDEEQQHTAQGSGPQESRQSESQQPEQLQPENGTETQDDQSETAENGNREEKKNIKVKAVYLTGHTAGTESMLDHFIELVKTTELNALVIDIKDDGFVNYESNVPEVRDNQLFKKRFDVDHVLKKLHDNGVFVIGRIVCFKDNQLATKRPELAIKRPNGAFWKENGTTAWLNPYKEETWKYNIDIAKEAIDKGFDEIQFDYVRFPSARASDVVYGSDLPSKVDAICGFLEMASKELREGKGALVSADVFGIIYESVSDGKAIGQDLERLGVDIDYICPMVYPSHYANAGSRGKVIMGNGVGQTINGVLFTAPDLKPYDVVYNTLIKGKERISKVEGYNAKTRPFLQDFTATYIKDKQYYQQYGPEQVRQQIKAVYDAGYEEWILWSASNRYSEAAFEKEDGN